MQSDNGQQSLWEQSDLLQLMAGAGNGISIVAFPWLVLQRNGSALDASIMVPRALASCVTALDANGLGSIEVRNEDGVWTSHDAPVGWVLAVSPWEAVRVLYSRRTADELRDLGGSDDLEAYISLLDAHLPLPQHSLGE